MVTAEPTYMEAVAHGKRDCREYYQKLHNGEINTDAEHIPLCPYRRPESLLDKCPAWRGWMDGWDLEFNSLDRRTTNG